jgi:hypothetical protein
MISNLRLLSTNPHPQGWFFVLVKACYNICNMVNPFDRTFFRFLLGFTLILVVSFAILFFVEQYSSEIDQRSDAILGKAYTDMPKIK